ncbi:MAG: radical SAM protein [Candidatus Lernaella stagnicola]|nr:radical SAM protein [Candidatus Lernaella stagnicola]
MSDVRRANAERLRQERARGETVLSARPVELQIEPTNRCHRACPTCARHFYDRAANTPGDLTPALLELIAPLFDTAQQVLLGGYGEPLLAAITEDILGQANAAGCRTAMITGAGDLDDEKAAMLAGVALDEIVVSVDSADDAGMRRWRGITLTTLLANLEKLRSRRPETRAAFNVTVHVSNLDELPDIVRVAAKHGVERVAVFHQKIYSVTQRGSSVLSIPEHAARRFAEADEVAAEAGVEIDLPPTAGTRPCEQPYRMLVFRHDGLVQGCCSALFESHIPRVVLGRLGEDDPLALWNSPAMVAARAATLGCGPNDFACHSCPFRVFTAEAHERFLDVENNDDASTL